jgi:phenylacetate-CoA ligase
MIIIHGVNVFPSVIERALCRVPGLTANYQIKVWEVDGFQQMSISCERTADSQQEIAEVLLEKGKKSIHSALGIHVPLTVAEPGTLPRFEGKSKHIVRE